MLGTVDFSGVKDLEIVTGDFPGQTAGWEPKTNEDGTIAGVICHFDYEDNDGKKRKFNQNYSLNADALWRIKRDMISMGVGPQEFESANVDLETILNALFGPPYTPVTLTFTKRDGTGQWAGRTFQNLNAVKLREE